MESFKLILKNDKLKSYRVIALLILLINAAIFCWLLFYDEYRTESLSALAVLIIYIALQWNYVRKGRQQHYFNEFLFFVLAFCWIGLGMYLFAGISLVLAILYFLALQKLEFIFNEEMISKKNFPAKQYDWHQFSNVMLKDNILTLDFKNNKILQGEIEESGNTSEFDFNVFARQKIATSSPIIN